MALKQVIESQTEIPSGVQEHYVEHDGKWLLQTDPQFEDVTALKGVLNQERNLRREAEKTTTDLKVRFEGVDVDEYHKLQDRMKGLDEAEIYDKHGIEVLVSRRTDAMKQEHDRQLQAKERELAQLRGQVVESDRRWRHDRLRTTLLEAVNKNGVYEKAIDDAVQRGLAVFTDLDEKGLAVAKNGEDVLYGKDGINPLRPDEWISTLKTSGQAPHLWPPSSGGGAPAHHSANGQGIDWNAITNPAERMTRYREWQAAQQR